MSTTSGRNVVLELMQYENFRQAARHYHRILQHPETAADDKDFQKLPRDIQVALLKTENVYLRSVLLPRRTKSPYVSQAVSDPNEDVVNYCRIGPPVEQDMEQMHALSQFEQILLKRIISDDSLNIDIDNLPDNVLRHKSAVLPNRSPYSGTLYAPGRSHKYQYFLEDSVIDEKKQKEIVQLEDLFVIGDYLFARVTWGKKTHVEPETGCQGYVFQEVTNGQIERKQRNIINHPTLTQLQHFETIVNATRLTEYVHFGYVYKDYGYVNVLRNKDGIVLTIAGLRDTGLKAISEVLAAKSLSSEIQAELNKPQGELLFAVPGLQQSPIGNPELISLTDI